MKAAGRFRFAIAWFDPTDACRYFRLPNENSTGSIAARPCTERKSGAPTALLMPARRKARATRPDSNTGRFLSEGTLTDAEGVNATTARALDGNQGGLDELEVPNAETQIDFLTIDVPVEPF